MTMAIRAVAQSHVGLVRHGNEDSGYAGPRLLVVADGMGGHAAGEVASAVTVEVLSDLDGPGPAPPDLASDEALTGAINHANHRIRDLVDADPKRSGMGTTVTAMLWTGNGFTLAHIGDSRAYVLRDGELEQLTRDHTYVQALIDEGRIREDERESHPARSLLLQALGGDDVQPDLADLVAEPGDRVLLCSDGLSGVVGAQAIRAVLADEPDPQVAVDRLVELAVQAGGPDNITCVVADVRESTHEPHDDDTTEAHLVGAAAIGAAHPDALRYDENGVPQEAESPPTARDHEESDDLDPEEAAEAERYAPRHRGRTRWFVAGIAVLLLAALAVGGVRELSAWYDQQYYVGLHDNEVVIKQGLPGVPGASVVESVPDLPADSLPEHIREDVADGIRADDMTDAQAIADRVRREACRANKAGPEISGFPGLDCSALDEEPTSTTNEPTPGSGGETPS